MTKTRIPRKLKKQLKAREARNEQLRQILLADMNKRRAEAEAQPDSIRVGDTVRVGKGKTEWYVETGYTDKLVLKSPGGKTKNVSRDEIDTLTKV